MTEDANIAIITKLYNHFIEGDVAAVLDCLSDDVHWYSHLEPSVPWSGDYSGKAKVAEFFKAIAGSVEFSAFEPQEWIAQGDRVVSLGRSAGTVPAAGKVSETRWCFIWTVRDGKVTSYEQFHDYHVAEAFS